MSDREQASRSRLRMTDEQVELVIGNLLRAGVLLAALVVVTGGVLYLLRYGQGSPNYHAFHGVPAALRHVTGVIQWAFALHSRGVIQLGLLLLIATPIARVLFSLLAFILQRDRTYIVVTSIVLCILLYSLLAGSHI